LSSARPKGKQPRPDKTPRDGLLIATWILSATIVLVTVFVRIRLLHMPLERDEGEFAYVGQLILKGIVPFKIAYNMKLPGIYAVYALIMAIFGQTDTGIRIGLLLANLATAVLVFALARRLWNTQLALIAAASYPVLTLSRAVIGLAAHATQFQMPMVVGGVILLLKALESDRRSLLFLSGLLMGLAFITKQHAILFVAFGGCYLLWELIRSRALPRPAIVKRAAVYTLGAVIPFAVVCITVLAAGVFGKFWFWTFTYAHQYTTEMPVPSGLFLLRAMCVQGAGYIAALEALAAVGLLAVWCDRKLRPRAVLVTGFLLSGFLATAPGLYFREHYFVMMMPAMSLLIGASVMWIGQLLSRLRFAPVLRFVPLLLFLAAVAQVMIVSREVFFESTLIRASRLTYGASPFPESITVAEYIKERTSPDDKIAVLGSEPQIYFYADRLSATGYLYTYGMAEKQPYALRMQQEMSNEIEAAKPKYIVYVNVGGSWLFRSWSDRWILTWFAKYASAHYKVVGLADIISGETTNYYWGGEADYFAPDSEEGLVIFERRPDR